MISTASATSDVARILQQCHEELEKIRTTVGKEKLEASEIEFNQILLERMDELVIEPVKPDSVFDLPTNTAPAMTATMRHKAIPIAPNAQYSWMGGFAVLSAGSAGL